MYFSAYHTYVIGIFVGLLIVLLALIFVGFGKDAGYQQDQQIIIQAVDFIDNGDVYQGLHMLQKLADDNDNLDAMKVLAEEFSDDDMKYYDIDMAFHYAQLYKEEAGDGDAFFQKIKERALKNWQK